ncbi:hypothetical protein D3C80_1045590 [compost metagenome]
MQPDTAAVTFERRDPPAQHGKPRAAQLADLEYRIPAPDTLARQPRLVLGRPQAVDQRGIRRYGDGKAQPRRQLLRLPAVSVTAEGMRQAASVVIARLLAGHQPDLPTTGRDQLLEVMRGHLGKGLGRLPGTGLLRCIDPDQAHAAPVRQAQGVAIHHPGHLCLAQRAGRPAGIGQRPQRREYHHGTNKKGAPQGRLFCCTGKQTLHPGYALLTWSRRSQRNAA